MSHGMSVSLFAARDLSSQTDREAWRAEFTDLYVPEGPAGRGCNVKIYEHMVMAL